MLTGGKKSDKFAKGYFFEPTVLKGLSPDAKILSDELPSIILTGNPNMHAYVSSMKNVTPTTPPLTIGRITWNIQSWELS